MRGWKTCLRLVTRVCLAHAISTMPLSRRSWAVAMEQESHFIDNDFDALGWAIGCVFASYVEGVREMSIYRRTNLLTAIIPVIMSLLALAVVLAVVTTGWERHLQDEGAAAHIFQLLIVGQVPFLAAYLVTSKGRRVLEIVRPMAFQAGALAIAIGSVAFFKL